MIKLYVDDQRKAPEGWHQVWSINEAIDFIEENYADISHIDFDYYLNEDMPAHNGARLIRELLRMKIMGIDVFHQSIENYTFHSSDSSMNDEMRSLLERGLGVEVKTAKKSQSRLQMMRSSKGRR